MKTFRERYEHALRNKVMCVDPPLSAADVRHLLAEHEARRTAEDDAALDQFSDALVQDIALVAVEEYAVKCGVRLAS